MSILEQTLPASLQGEYFTVLLEKVQNDQRPSITMLRRIQQLSGQL